jgi:hypothetical protein
MRFIYKRPKMKDVSAELDTLMDVMLSKIFIFIDLFFICLSLSLLLLPVYHSIEISLLIFISSYLFFTCLYFLVFKKSKKNLIGLNGKK